MVRHSGSHRDPKLDALLGEEVVVELNEEWGKLVLEGVLEWDENNSISLCHYMVKPAIATAACRVTHLPEGFHFCKSGVSSVRRKKCH